jgi:signal transduction histidine kinase
MQPRSRPDPPPQDDAAATLAQKLDALTRLVGGFAHDLRNQLTSILGYSELLLWSLDEQDARRADVEEIRNAAVRATRVTQQLLGAVEEPLTPQDAGGSGDQGSGIRDQDQGSGFRKSDD